MLNPVVWIRNSKFGRDACWSFSKIYVYDDDDDVSSFVCRRNGWQADDLGSLLIIVAVPPCHQPGSVIKICAHTLENGFFHAPSVWSTVKMFCHTWRTETAVHLKHNILHCDQPYQILGGVWSKINKIQFEMLRTELERWTLTCMDSAMIFHVVP